MNKSTFNMLTFDGGGLRGSLSIRLFDKIQKEYPNILKETNLLGGTSTGSLIALGLSYGLSCESIKKLYSLEYAKYIFKNPQQEIFRPKYNNKLSLLYRLSLLLRIAMEITANIVKKYQNTPVNIFTSLNSLVKSNIFSLP